MKLFAFCLLILAAFTVGQNIVRFADMSANALFDANGILPTTKQLPQSYRTFYACYNRVTGAVAADTKLNNFIPIELAAPVVGETRMFFKLESPSLEVDPWGCDAALGGSTGDCRCNVGTSPTITGNPQTVTFADATKIANFRIPTSTYFEHAPFPGQSPWMKTYRKLCYQRDGEALWHDSTIWIAVVNCCSVDTDCTLAATPSPISWRGAVIGELNGDADNFNLTSPVPCNNRKFLGAWFDFNVDATPALLNSAINGVDFVEGEGCYGETPDMTNARLSRSQCCGARTGGDLPRFGVATTTKRGTCINPKVEACCGWKPFNPKYEQCCSKRTLLDATIDPTDVDEKVSVADSARIQYTNQACPCRSDQVANDCQRYGPNSVGNVADSRGELDGLVTTRQCCVPTKFAELNSGLRKTGYCYEVDTANQQCCDDGNVYDAGAQQCCKVNGVQTLNIPCPCDRDEQCNGQQKCCMQQFPPSWVEGQGPNVHGDDVWRAFQSTAATSTYLTPESTGFPANFNYDGANVRAWQKYYAAQFPRTQSACSKYSNWPVPTTPAEVNRCLGNCIDPRFQTCCNGAICVKQYDRCCNSTCCNRFTSGCMEGYRPGTRGAGNRVNPNDYRVSFESCTSVEIFTTRRAFWVWVMPTFWCIATVFSLAIVAAVARRATENVFPLTERCMVVVALICLLFSTLHFFAPTYKYGIVVVFTSMFVIVGAVSQSAKMSLVSCILVLLMLILWFDPFEGNIYLSLTGGYVPTAAIPDTLQTRFFPNYSSGILEALMRYERNREDCVSFYDYFAIDPLIHDTARFANPNKNTFGFCTRAWMTTLLIFSIATLAFLLVLFTLSIFSFVKKLMPKSVKEDLAYELPLDAAPY